MKICESLELLHKRNKDLYNLHVDLLDFTDDFYVIITTLLEEIYGENADLITDWIYCSWDGKMYEKDSKTLLHDLDTEEKLWEYLEKQ